METYKVLIVGDASAGKTCLLQRYARGFYSMDTIQTLGIDSAIRTVNVNGRWMKLKIWDTAGQERFRSITHPYYRDATGVLLIYDVTNWKTFSTLTNWLIDIKQHAPENVPLIIVGNKSDSNERVITTEEGYQFATARNLKFVETSAKENINVENAFETLAQAMATNTTPRDITMPQSVIGLDRSHSSTSAPPNADEGRKSQCSPC